MSSEVVPCIVPHERGGVVQWWLAIVCLEATAKLTPRITGATVGYPTLQTLWLLQMSDLVSVIGRAAGLPVIDRHVDG
jgi:hypothetical protein